MMSGREDVSPAILSAQWSGDPQGPSIYCPHRSTTNINKHCYYHQGSPIYCQRLLTRNKKSHYYSHCSTINTNTHCYYPYCSITNTNTHCYYAYCSTTNTHCYYPHCSTTNANTHRYYLHHSITNFIDLTTTNCKWVKRMKAILVIQTWQVSHQGWLSENAKHVFLHQI